MKKTALLALAGAITLSLPLAASAQNYPGRYNGNYNGSYNGGNQNASRSGRIASVQGSSFTLADGTSVFLHQGTVINPTGQSLQSGQNVSISGSRDGRGRFNADVVNIGGYNNGGYNGGGYNGGGYNNGNYNNGNNGNHNGEWRRSHRRDDRNRDDRNRDDRNRDDRQDDHGNDNR